MCDGYIKSHGFYSNDSSCCSTTLSTFCSFSMVSFRSDKSIETTEQRIREGTHTHTKKNATEIGICWLFRRTAKECWCIWKGGEIISDWPFIFHFFKHFLVHFKPIKIGILFHIRASVNIAFGVARSMWPLSLLCCALPIVNVNLASEKILRCIFLIRPHTIPNVSFQSNQNITKCEDAKEWLFAMSIRTEKCKIIIAMRFSFATFHQIQSLAIATLKKSNQWIA